MSLWTGSITKQNRQVKIASEIWLITGFGNMRQSYKKYLRFFVTRNKQKNHFYLICPTTYKYTQLPNPLLSGNGRMSVSKLEDESAS